MSVAPVEHMARALQLAARGRYTTFPNPRVGCLIVRGDTVVGEGWHARAGEPHAEVLALRAAGDRARGADAYVTLEPYSHHGRTGPCADALMAVGVRRVWAAMRDPNPLVAGRGFEKLRAAGIEVNVGILEGAARELNRGFVSRMERGRPYLMLKLAASLDGRTAMASGESKWITGEAARADVHRLRAEAGAVLSGAGTVVADDPQLNVRGVDGASRVPDRVVLDTRARVPASARIWNQDGGRRIRIVAGSPPGTEIDGVQRLSVAMDAQGHVQLGLALAALAVEGINSVFVECGATLAGALLRENRVDELILYLSPSMLGDDARGLARLPGLQSLSQRIQLQFHDVRSVGPDLRIIAIPVKGAH